MKFEQILTKFAMSKSAAAERLNKIPRRNSLYKGEGKIVNKRTKKEVQAECHQNIVFELIESQISNAIPEPNVTPLLGEDVQRAQSLSNYLSQEMKRQMGIKINDRAERGVLKNGYHFYLIEWDNSRRDNSGFGHLKLTEYGADAVYTQPGIADFDDSEYIFLKNTVTTGAIKRLYHIDISPDSGTIDTADIITCYFLNDDGDLGRAIFAAKSLELITYDEYFELRRVTVCEDCGQPIVNLDVPCPVCKSNRFVEKILEEETAVEDIYTGNLEENVRQRALLKQQGQPDDPYAGLTKIVSKGDKIPFYHIRELPVVMRLAVSDDTSIFGISDIDMVEQNQDTLNRITTKEEENILKAGSFVTYPQGTKVPADDSTLKLVPISDPRLIDAFSVQTIQANMQQDDIFAQRMYQYGRATLGITESFQGKRDTTATSGKAKMLAAAQSAGRLESKQRMKIQAYSDLYRKQFKFLLAYADETQHYIKRDTNGDILEQTFNRYMFLKRNADNQLYWDDNFIIEADNSTLITNKAELWQTLTQQFMAGTFGSPTDPQVMKLYWDIMKQLQFPFAAAIQTNLVERQVDIDPVMKQFLLQHPDILKTVARLMAAEQSNGQMPAKNSNSVNNKNAQTPGVNHSTNSSAGAQNSASKMKTGGQAMQAPEPANPLPPDMRLEQEAANA